MVISLECLDCSISAISVLGYVQVVKFLEKLGVVLAHIFDQSRVNFLKFGLLDNLDHQAVQKLAIAALQRSIELAQPENTAIGQAADPQTVAPQNAQFL